MTEFKVGDWVINKSSGIVFKYSNEMLKPDPKCCELWQPKKGEWCWFSKNNSTYFAKLMEIDLDDIEGDIYTVRDLNYNTIFCSYCEPFIGQLPSLLKGV